MNWLCWHVGTVTDPKIGRVADACQTARVNVLGVWAVILEKAKEGRGLYTFDADDAAYALGIDAGLVAAIHAELEAKGLVSCGEVVNWLKRQHGTSAVRMARKRAEQNEQAKHVTHSDAQAVNVRTVTPTDRQTDIQTDKEIHTDTAQLVAARESDLPERIEAIIGAAPEFGFGLPSACEMLFREGHTELEILDAAHAIAARGVKPRSPNYLIQTVRGTKADAARPSQPRKPRYNPADASSPESVADRRSKIAAGMRAAFPGLGGEGDAGPSG